MHPVRRSTIGERSATLTEGIHSGGICLDRDRDEGAVNAARRNAERAQVAIDVRHHAVSDSQPPAETGLLLTNPPYGARIGNPGRLRDLYATLGKLASRQYAEWSVGFITTDERLAQASGLAFTRSTPPLPHGGLRVKLYLREAA